MGEGARLTLVPPAGDPVGDLTPREREVLRLIAGGRSNRAICAELFVAPKTLERHIANIYEKLDLGQHDDRRHRRVAASLMWLRSPVRTAAVPAPQARAARATARTPPRAAALAP